jgi:hypothetical protein
VPWEWSAENLPLALVIRKELLDNGITTKDLSRVGVCDGAQVTTNPAGVYHTGLTLHRSVVYSALYMQIRLG